MSEKTQVLKLTENLFVGKGMHKEVYYHPYDKGLCVKLLYSEADVDWERELHYRNVRAKRKQKSILLPEYFGAVTTNKGTGHIFELVCDYDGEASITLKEYLAVPPPERCTCVL